MSNYPVSFSYNSNNIVAKLPPLPSTKRDAHQASQEPKLFSDRRRDQESRDELVPAAANSNFHHIQEQSQSDHRDDDMVKRYNHKIAYYPSSNRQFYAMVESETGRVVKTIPDQHELAAQAWEQQAHKIAPNAATLTAAEQTELTANVGTTLGSEHAKTTKI